MNEKLKLLMMGVVFLSGVSDGMNIDQLLNRGNGVRRTVVPELQQLSQSSEERQQLLDKVSQLQNELNRTKSQLQLLLNQKVQDLNTMQSLANRLSRLEALLGQNQQQNNYQNFGPNNS